MDTPSSTDQLGIGWDPAMATFSPRAPTGSSPRVNLQSPRTVWPVALGVATPLGLSSESAALARLASVAEVHRNPALTEEKKNTIGSSSNNTSNSGFRGVSRASAGIGGGDSKWTAQIVINSEIVAFGGKFDSDIEAAKKYDELARERFGKHAILNFLSEDDVQKGRKSANDAIFSGISDSELLMMKEAEPQATTTPHEGRGRKRTLTTATTPTIDNSPIDDDNSEVKKGRSKLPSSVYLGVSRLSRTGRWQARIRVKDKNIQLGSFATEEEAARRYDVGAREFHGVKAVLNFPNDEDFAVGRKWALQRGSLPGTRASAVGKASAMQAQEKFAQVQAAAVAAASVPVLVPSSLSSSSSAVAMSSARKASPLFAPPPPLDSPPKSSSKKAATAAARAAAAASILASTTTKSTTSGNSHVPADLPKLTAIKTHPLLSSQLSPSFPTPGPFSPNFPGFQLHSSLSSLPSYGSLLTPRFIGTPNGSNALDLAEYPTNVAGSSTEL